MPSGTAKSLAVAAGMLIGTVTMATAGLAQAPELSQYTEPHDQFYKAPVERAHGLRFADLEGGMPGDPLIWSSDPGWQLHRTPSAQLADATAQLRTAIPIGSPVGAATALLRAAGARCGGTAAGRLVCRYHDIQTPLMGRYRDDVFWRVWLDVDGDRVGHVEVTRDWTRER